MAALVDLLLQRAISKSFRSLTEQEAQYPSPATSSEQPSCSEQRALDARCRLCLGGPDELDCGSLVSPCACKGSCAHIHSGCLQQWQRLLWETGQCQKALHCDICKQPYREGFASAPFGPAEPLAARVTRVAQRLARSPERAVRLWRYAILAGGLAVAARQGLTGLSVGACLGVRLAAPLAAFLFKLAPEVGLLAALVPASKPAVRLMCCLFGGALAVEVTLASAAGLVAGGVIGFCRGSAGVVRATADVGCASARGALALLGGVANAGGLLPTWSGLGRSRAAGGAAQQA